MFDPGRMCPVLTLDTDNSLFYWWRRDCREKETNHCSLTLFSHLNLLINLSWLPAPSFTLYLLTQFPSLGPDCLARSSWSPWRPPMSRKKLCVPSAHKLSFQSRAGKEENMGTWRPGGVLCACIRRYSESLKKKNQARCGGAWKWKAVVICAFLWVTWS